MTTVFKYALEITDRQEIPLPPRATILSAQVQRGKICLWVSIDPDELNLAEPRHIRIHGTGHLITESLRFIDTVQLSGGKLVFHVFEVTDLRLN